MTHVSVAYFPPFDMSNHVTRQYLSFLAPCHLSLRLMSRVDFKKSPCRHVVFKGLGPWSRVVWCGRLRVRPVYPVHCSLDPETHNVDQPSTLVAQGGGGGLLLEGEKGGVSLFRPPLNKKLFPVHRPAVWNFFFFIFSKTFFFLLFPLYILV